VSLTIRALLLFWPFLKRAVFGDRTIKEVVLANKHITVVNVCMFIAFIAFMNAVIELSVVKSEKKQLEARLAQVCVIPEAATLQERRKLLGDILK
jgi:hypothetical protein